MLTMEKATGATDSGELCRKNKTHTGELKRRFNRGIIVPLWEDDCHVPA